MSTPATFSDKILLDESFPRRHPHVLIVPFPAQGHMLPLLDLAHLLSSRHHLAVTIAFTEKNLSRLSDLLDRSPDIRPLVLSFPSHPDLPAGVENAQNLTFNYLRTLVAAFGGIKQQILDWARIPCNSIDIIIADFFCGWTNRVAGELGVPNLVFSPSGAFGLSVYYEVWQSMPKRFDSDDFFEKFKFDSVPSSPVFPWCHLPYNYQKYEKGDPTSEIIKDGIHQCLESWGFVFNTFSELEREFLDDHRKKLGHGRVWAVGPLAPAGGRSSDEVGVEIREFLDGCEKRSVVYVCFGSQAGFSAEAASALATALERSGAHFIWCVKAEGQPPKGFEGRMTGRGIVVRGWAPQVGILSHESVGSFVSHCGWNSVLEAVEAGVTILTWPLSADQFINAGLVLNLGIGVQACEGGFKAIPDPTKLGRVIAESVAEPGSGMRKRAQAMGMKAKAAFGPEGSAYKDLEDLVNHISNLKH